MSQCLRKFDLITLSLFFYQAAAGAGRADGDGAVLLLPPVRAGHAGGGRAPGLLVAQDQEPHLLCAPGREDHVDGAGQSGQGDVGVLVVDDLGGIGVRGGGATEAGGRCLLGAEQLRAPQGGARVVGEGAARAAWGQAVLPGGSGGGRGGQRGDAETAGERAPEAQRPGPGGLCRLLRQLDHQDLLHAQVGHLQRLLDGQVPLQDRRRLLRQSGSHVGELGKEGD